MKDQKYNELINRIKTEKPELDNPQMLTADILIAVEKIANNFRINRALRLISWASTTAAVLLIGLFLIERPSSIIYPAQKTSYSNYNSYTLTETEIDGTATLNTINSIVRKKREYNRRLESFRISVANKYQSPNQI